jgi:hypothetical protein
MFPCRVERNRLMAWSAEQTRGERFAAGCDVLAIFCPRWRLGGSYTGWCAALQAWSGPLRPAVAKRLRRHMQAFAGRHGLREGWCAFAAQPMIALLSVVAVLSGWRYGERRELTVAEFYPA